MSKVCSYTLVICYSFLFLSPITDAHAISSVFLLYIFNITIPYQLSCQSWPAFYFPSGFDYSMASTTLSLVSPSMTSTPSSIYSHFNTVPQVFAVSYCKICRQLIIYCGHLCVTTEPSPETPPPEIWTPIAVNCHLRRRIVLFINYRFWAHSWVYGWFEFYKGDVIKCYEFLQ